MKKIARFSTMILLAALAAFTSCRKSRSDIGAVLFKETKNKVFKKIDSAKYYETFKKVLNEEGAGLDNAALIRQFYVTNDYEPYFIVNFVKDKQLLDLVGRYGQATSHGLDPNYFNYDKLEPLVDKIYQKKGIRQLDEAYRDIALTELYSASSLVKYATVLKYGLVNPRKIFARYYMKTEKPDSVFMRNVLSVNNLKAFLDSIQPAGEEYKKLQEAISSNFAYAGMSAEQTKKTLALNLERLRWRNKPSTDRYVWVNIPDYTLKYVENGRTALTMKVCVGKGPDQSLADADYDESEGSVRPHDHTTPQLSSEINNVQVNPIWNIPESIAKNEIIGHAKSDPYYLSNNNINVYTKSGQQVDPDQVDWSDAAAGSYSFKQAPGDDNALGKIKFQFPNSSSVYLHDTPAKKPFQQEVRAVSHGCVRLEKPMEFASAIFGGGNKYAIVQKEVAEKNPTSRDIAVSPKIPVFLDYQTAFVNDQGVQVRPDVYKLDEVLYRRMGKAFAFRE